jgi:hypothetical protein
MALAAEPTASGRWSSRGGLLLLIRPAHELMDQVEQELESTPAGSGRLERATAFVLAPLCVVLVTAQLGGHLVRRDHDRTQRGVRPRLNQIANVLELADEIQRVGALDTYRHGGCLDRQWPVSG